MPTFADGVARDPVAASHCGQADGGPETGLQSSSHGKQDRVAEARASMAGRLPAANYPCRAHWQIGLLSESDPKIESSRILFSIFLRQVLRT